MPLYEYECSACGRRSEVLQKFSDEPLTTCSHCGGPVQRLISSSAIHFKGTGWYVTDYAQKSTTPPAGNGKDKKDKEETPSTASAKESKPDQKTADSSVPSSPSD